jgi:DNA-binding FrmR family transcriptional regulator
MVRPNARAAAIRHARRVSGQVGALSEMIGAGRPIGDLAQQVVAARSSLDALLIRLIELELDACPSGQDGRPAVDRLVRLALGQRGARGAQPATPLGAPR